MEIDRGDSASMTEEEAELVWGYIENEGFDYCFRRYSSFKNVKDEKFHELRKAYCEAGDALEEYLEQWNPDEM